MKYAYLTKWFLVVFPSLFTARAEDCDGLTQCMKNYGAQFQSIKLRADMTSDEGVYKFLDTICTPSNMDALVDCYSPQNMMGCAILSNVVKQIPSQETLRNQFTKVCSQKEELLETSKCILKEAVSTAIADCSIKIAQTSSDDQDKSALICSRMSSMMTCIESAMKGQCPEKTIEYVESSNKNQYTEFCSGSQIMINLLLVSFLLIFIQLVN